VAKLFNFYLINSQLFKIHKCQKNDSPVEYNCKISRQKTALTDTLYTMSSQNVHLLYLEYLRQNEPILTIINTLHFDKILRETLEIVHLTC